uniref:ATP-dependent DNA helicase 2 subunit KU70 n=1 Tax=Aegilops tauschii subsp. strangulata TaxID=200361 RepID=A0A453JQ65_AEGTS
HRGEHICANPSNCSRGTITWLDSISNLPLKTERSFICNDTGALLQAPQERFQLYNDKVVKFSVRELSDVKRVSSHHLRLLGFKPLDCLKDYHNLSPSTFIYPSDEQIFGSTRVFVALHSSMLRLGRFALAFYGTPTRPRLVALVAQEEVISSSGQDEPPGMHMIYLPYSDDVRYPEEVHLTSGDAPRATDEQIKKASNLLRRIDLKHFSVSHFANPGLQKHYGILEALALGEDEMPDIKDETLPDEEGLARPGVVKAIEEFKAAVFGENYDQEEAEAAAAKGGASKKRKAIADAASQKSAAYDWADLADNGKLKDMTVMDLKTYLTAHGLAVSGKKDAIISRILTHLGK